MTPRILHPSLLFNSTSGKLVREAGYCAIRVAE